MDLRQLTLEIGKGMIDTLQAEDGGWLQDSNISIRTFHNLLAEQKNPNPEQAIGSSVILIEV